MAIDISLLRSQIGDMNNRFRHHRAPNSGPSGTDRRTPPIIGKGGRRIVRRCEAKAVAAPVIDVSKAGVADANGIL